MERQIGGVQGMHGGTGATCTRWQRVWRRSDEQQGDCAHGLRGGGEKGLGGYEEVRMGLGGYEELP
eukprot:5848950-Pleurochrysis_carterae.AAC.2